MRLNRCASRRGRILSPPPHFQRIVTNPGRILYGVGVICQCDLSHREAWVPDFSSSGKPILTLLRIVATLHTEASDAKRNFGPEQIRQAPRQAAAGTVVGETCRKMGVTEATLFRWRETYAGLDVGELQELRGENRRLGTW